MKTRERIELAAFIFAIVATVAWVVVYMRGARACERQGGVYLRDAMNMPVCVRGERVP